MVLRRLLIALSLVAAVGLGAAASASAATVALSVSADATEDKPVTIRATGSSEIGRRLFSYRWSGSATCPATAGDAYAAPASSSLSPYEGVAVGPGAFSNEQMFTPSETGTYTVCAYVAESRHATPSATARATFGVACNGPCPPPAPAVVTTPTIYTPAYPIDDDDAGYRSRPGLVYPDLAEPADALSGEQLNPTFRWFTDPVHGSRYDRLRIQRNELDRSTTKLVDLTDGGAVSYLDEDDRVNTDGTELDLSDVAEVRKDATSFSVRLKSVLPPGSYSWFVLRHRPGRFEDDPADYIASELRTFKVLGPKLNRLAARQVSRRGRTSASPGHSVVHVSTTPFARVRYELARQGRRAALYSQADREGRSSLPLAWSCTRPGGRYDVTVVASDQYGSRRSVGLRFAPVSEARCKGMARAEARARRIRAARRAARQRAADRRYAREQAAIERAERRSQARRMSRFRSNCRAIGGSPVTIQTGDGPYTVCRSPIGGILTVPGMN